MTKPAPRILVVTDRFPPDIVGGAELSLVTTLNNIPSSSFDLHVAALTNGITRPRTEQEEHYTVHRIPYDDAWPIDANLPRSRRYIQLLLSLVSQVSQGNFRYVWTTFLFFFTRIFYLKAFQVFPLFDKECLLQGISIQHLRRLVDQLKPDVIHADNYRSILLANGLNSNVPVLSLVRDNRFFCAERNQATNIGGALCHVCAFGCVVEDIPAWVRNSMIDNMKQVRKIRQDSLQKSAQIIVTSKYLEGQIKSVLPSSQPVIVTNPIEPPDLIDEWTRDCARAEVQEILCVGSITPNKGQAQLLRLLPGILNHCKEVRIVFAGEGSDSANLRNLALEQGTTEHVTLAGFLQRPALYQAYARAAFVVCPGVWPEPFGRVPLEAAASGKAVITFDTGGIGESIEHGKNGFLVNVGDFDAMEQTIVRLLLNPTLASTVGEEAHRQSLNSVPDRDTASNISQLWRQALPVQV